MRVAFAVVGMLFSVVTLALKKKLYSDKVTAVQLDAEGRVKVVCNTDGPGLAAIDAAGMLHVYCECKK